MSDYDEYCKKMKHIRKLKDKLEKRRHKIVLLTLQIHEDYPKLETPEEINQRLNIYPG